MTSRDEVVAEIIELAAERLRDTAELTANSRLVEDAGLDSLQLLALAVEIENHFEICLNEAEEASIETLGDLADVVARKRAVPE